MVLSPVYFLVLIYFLANSYSAYNLLRNNGFEAFGEFFYIDSSVAIFSYILQVFFLLVLFLYYFFYASKKKVKRILSNNFGYFLFFLTVAYFIFNQLTGAGRAGSGFSFNGGSLLNIFFVLLQPDLLFLIIAPFLRSSRIFHLVSIVYFVSLLSRGWMGSVLLLVLIYLIRYYPVRLKLKNIYIFVFLGLVVFFSLPFLDGLKWGMRNGLAFFEIIEQVLSKDYFEVLAVVVESVLGRFQNINYAAYTLQHNNLFHNALLQGDFVWFYQAGMPHSIYCKLSSCSPDLNLFSAETIYGEKGLTWNIDPGLTGWFFLLNGFAVFFLMFLMLLLSFSYRTFCKVYGHKGIMLLACFSYVYLFHGWLGAFYNLILYAVFLSLLIRFKFTKKKATI